MTDKELDDLFKQSFAGHEMPVPDDMWQRVQPQKDKKRRGIILWWSGLGVAAALILMSTATWFYFHQETSATVAAASSLQKEKEITLQKPADKTSGQQKPTSGSALPVNNTNSTALSITKPSEQKENNNTIFSTEKKKEKENGNFVSASNNTLSKKENSQAKEAARQHENVFQHNDILPNKTTDKTNDSAAVMLAEKTTETSPDPGKDSSNSVPDIATGKEAAKAIEAAAIQIKKHRNKAASIELMIAGYTGDNNIYGTEKNVQPQFARLGFIDPQEKTTLRSGSVNMRIEKPVTENLSVKTGLQFLQAHQRVTYTLESVDQFAVVTSLGVNNDTTRYAQIHSEHRVVKSVYNSLNVPLLLSYHTSGSNLSVGASGGVLLNLVSWYKGKVPDGDYKRTVAAKNTFRWNSGASLYLSLNAAKTFGNWQLFAEPHIQYTLSSLTKNSASFRQKMTYYGFGIGIRKRIGK